MCDLFYNAVDINYKKLYGAVASWPKIYPIKCGSSDRLFFRSVKIPCCINSIWLGSWNCKEILPRLSSLFNTFLKEEEEGVVAFVRVIHFSGNSVCQQSDWAREELAWKNGKWNCSFCTRTKIARPVFAAKTKLGPWTIGVLTLTIFGVAHTYH